VDECKPLLEGPIACVEMEWSLFSRDIEADIVPTCRELGRGLHSFTFQLNLSRV
jgi:aryl-alcohol dehydrogenase-like predicted oxidoreductase